MALTYPFPFHKLEISPQELKDIIERKVSAIWANPLTSTMKTSIGKVQKLLGHATNIGNSNSDQRRGEANANYQETGALPSAEVSPKKAQAQDPEYYGKATRAYQDDQKDLFDLLICEGMLENTIWLRDDGSLMREGETLTYIQMCNELDEVTKNFFNQPAVEPSITTGMKEGGRLSEMHDLCNEVVTKCMAAKAAIGYDLLNTDNNGGYEIWKNHVYMIASLAALMVSLDVARQSL